MQSDMLKKIAEDIEISYDNPEDQKIVFGKKRYNSIFIDKNNFEKIEKKEYEKKIAFIDGGNCEIIGSTNFSVQLMRIYSCIFESNKKIYEIKNEFFVLADSAVKNEDVFYNIKIYPLSGNFKIDDFSIDSMDEKIVEGGRRAKITKISDIVRRIGEIRLAEYIIENEKAEIIVFDGTLECTVGEKEQLEKVYENALIKDKIVCALAKTTNLFTDKGKNALVCINKLGEKGIWMYNNIAEINNEKHKAEISIVKLNENSKHCFRFEIFKMQKENKKEVLGYLAENSKDLSFPGYPYGMIVADRFARVSDNEKEYLKTLFLVKAGAKSEWIINETTSTDAHDILDQIN